MEADLRVRVQRRARQVPTEEGPVLFDAGDPDTVWRLFQPLEAVRYWMRRSSLESGSSPQDEEP